MSEPRRRIWMAAVVAVLTTAACLGDPTGLPPTEADAGFDAGTDAGTDAGGGGGGGAGGGVGGGVGGGAGGGGGAQGTDAGGAWPPTMSAFEVGAIGSGEVTGDTTDDLVVVAVGTEAAGAGVYVIAGGSDIKDQPDAGQTPATTYTRLGKIGDLGKPVAIALYDIDTASSSPAEEILILDRPSTGGQRLTILKSDLTVRSRIDFPSAVASNAARPFVSAGPLATFGAEGPCIFVSDGASVQFIKVSDAIASVQGVKEILQPDASTWDGVSAYAWFNVGANGAAHIAKPDTVWRVRPTGPPPAPFDYSRVRPDGGADWIAQAFVAVNQDAAPELVGIEASAQSKVCAWDPLSSVAGACFQTNADIPGGAAAQLIVEDVFAGPQPDVLLFRSGTPWKLSIYPSLRFEPDGGLTADAGVEGGAIPNSKIVTGDFVSTIPGKEVMIVDNKGKLECKYAGPAAVDFCFQ